MNTTNIPTVQQLQQIRDKNYKIQEKENIEEIVLRYLPKLIESITDENNKNQTHLIYSISDLKPCLFKDFMTCLRSKFSEYDIYTVTDGFIPSDVLSFYLSWNK